MQAYSHQFDVVFRKRMGYVDRIAVLVALALSLFASLVYSGLWHALLASVYQVPLLFVAVWLVKRARVANSPVEYSPAKTLAQQIALVAANRRSWATAAYYTVSSALIYGVFLVQLPLCGQYYLLAKEYRHKPAANDSWVYFWFHSAFVAVSYAAHHLVFQRHRLQFQYGVSSVRPESVLFSRLAYLVGHSVFFSVTCSLFGPIIYLLVRPFIYRANYLVFAVLSLDTAVPSFHVSFSTLFNVGLISFVAFFAWELLNHVFAIYATTGCLHHKKTVSSLSADPVETLLSGLRDVNEKNHLCRLTAFQELAYVATSPAEDCVKFRSAIYNSGSKKGFVWGAILDECSLVIKNTSSRINYRCKTDLEALRNSAAEPSANVNTSSLQKDNFLFGNSFDASANDTTNFAISATSSPVKQYESPEAAKSGFKNKHVAQLLDPVLQLLEPVVQFLNKHKLLTPTGKKSFLDSVHLAKQTAAFYYSQFLDTSVGVLFRTTLKRDTESRVLNPVNYGNAVIALAGLLLHAVEEDRSSTVTSTHISEVLNLLERPIRSCANYTDFVPASVYLTAAQRANEAATKNHLVALMHDLTMSEFFQLCVKYNYKLNDLSLSSRAFKLAKWVIDASIASQQKQSSQASKFL